MTLPICREPLSYDYALRERVNQGSIVVAVWRNYLEFFYVVGVENDLVTCIEIAQKLHDSEAFCTWTDDSLDACEKYSPRKDNCVILFNFLFDSQGLLTSGSNVLRIVHTLPAARYPLVLPVDAPIVCAFCKQDNAAAYETGLLSFFGSKWAHARCYFYSARESHESFEQVLRRAQALKCKVCTKRGASLGCAIRGCAQKYHYLCALNGGAEWVEETQLLYCSTHIQTLEQEARVASAFPTGDGAAPYLGENDWSAIHPLHAALLTQQSCLLEPYTAFWLQRKLHTPVCVVQIDAAHWAFDATQAPRKQYDVVASTNISPGMMVGEYVGQIVYQSKERQSDYAVELRFPQLPTMLVDSQHRGNEMRYVNSATDATRKMGIDANAKMHTFWCHGRPRVIVLASQFIKSGNSIVFDYGADYWANQ